MIPNKKLDDFANKASRAGTTYGKLQAQETMENRPSFRVPTGYTKIGDRLKDGNKQKES